MHAYKSSIGRPCYPQVACISQTLRTVKVDCRLTVLGNQVRIDRPVVDLGLAAECRLFRVVCVSALVLPLAYETLSRHGQTIGVGVGRTVYRPHIQELP